jgi:hypothetical protein
MSTPDSVGETYVRLAALWLLLVCWRAIRRMRCRVEAGSLARCDP